MRKIINPFVHTNGYNCFGCCPNHPIGLKLNFVEQDEFVICEWKPLKIYEGYQGVLHGGIQSLLIDEVGAWVVYAKIGTAGVTGKMEIKYRNPVSTDFEKIIIKGCVLEQTSRLAEIKVEICDSAGKVLTEGTVEYFLFPVEKAKTEMNYPGIEAFFEKERQ